LLTISKALSGPCWKYIEEGLTLLGDENVYFMYAYFKGLSSDNKAPSLKVTLLLTQVP
jgi:hypothetical protein